MSMTIMGDRTPRAVIQKSESHKLHHSFPVKKGKTIYQGQMVVLNDDGTIQAFESASELKNVIGYATTDSVNPAYTESKQYGPVEVTVAMKGFAIIYAAAGAATLKSGPVKPSGDMVNSRYAKYVSDSTSTNPMAFNLTPATSDGDLIQVLIL